MKFKVQHIVMGVLLIGASGYLLMPSDGSLFSSADEETEVPVFEAPKAVAVKEYSQQNSINVPSITPEEKTLSALEFQLRQAQIEAAIADAQSKSKRASMESDKDRAEIARIQAETEKARAEATRSNVPQMPFYPSPVSTPLPVESKSPSVDTEVVANKGNRVILNRINQGRVTLTVDSDIGTIGIGETFNGIKLISISANNNSIIAQNVRTKKTQTYFLATSSTRRFSQVEPIGSKAATETKTENESIRNLPSQITFDPFNGDK